jgi:hypothetical protein
VTSIPPDFDAASLADDILDGVDAIAAFLGWNGGQGARKVRYARETGSLPIRHKSGFGLFAFKTEIVATLSGRDTLPPGTAG